VLSEIIGGAGDQFVQLSVSGPLADPSVTRVVAPEIQKVLRKIQPEGAVLFLPDPRGRFISPKVSQREAL
jgi:hypothetical protein